MGYLRGYAKLSLKVRYRMPHTIITNTQIRAGRSGHLIYFRMQAAEFPRGCEIVANWG